MNIIDKRVSFDKVIIDFKTRKITWEGELQPLQGDKTWMLLEALVNKSPQLLSYEEIKGILWRKDKYEEFDRRNSIKPLINRIRKAIHDDTQQIIVSVPRRGYFFSAKHYLFDEVLQSSTAASANQLSSNSSKHLIVTWFDGTQEAVEVYREMIDEEGDRKFYQINCDGSQYCVLAKKDANGKENWSLVAFADWVDVAVDIRKKQLNMQMLTLGDCNETIYRYVARQKERIEQVFADYPQLAVFFKGKNSPMPNTEQQETCFSIVTIIGCYLHEVVPVLDSLPYYYARSILDWTAKVLSSPIVQPVIKMCPWLWEDII